MGTVTVQLTGDEARLLASLEKVIAKERQLATEAARVGTESERASERSARGIERVHTQQSSVLSQMKDLGVWEGLVGAVRVAYEKVDAVLTTVIEKQKKAADQVLASADGLAKLTQLSRGDPARQFGLEKNARDLYASGGGGSLSEAAGIVFDLEASGHNSGDARDLASRLYGKVDNVGAVVGGVRALQSAMGEKETGGLELMLSKGLIAAERGAGEMPDQLKAASRGAPFANMLGLSDEELMAAVSVASTPLGGAAEGGTAVSALLQGFQTAANKGHAFEGSLAEKVRKAARLSPRRREQLMGRSDDAARALNALTQNMDSYGQVLGDLSGADESVGAGMLSAEETSPALRAARRRRQVKARSELSQEESGLIRSEAEDLITEGATRMRKEGMPESLITAWEQQMRNEIDNPNRGEGYRSIRPNTGDSVTDRGADNVARNRLGDRNLVGEGRREQEAEYLRQINDGVQRQGQARLTAPPGDGGGN